MALVNDAMRGDIRKAVEELEKTTSGELVCVVAQSSARYLMFPLFWAALASLLLPIANPIAAKMGHIEPVVTFPVQSLVFVVLAGLFALTPLRLALTPRAIRAGNCRRSAFEQFFVRKLHETTKRTGVLLYVSVDERYVELIADKGINDKVLPDAWNAIIAALVADIRDGKVHEGFVKAVGACKAVLASHFPESRRDINELPDALVELPQADFIS
jgi:putative membrane protein